MIEIILPVFLITFLLFCVCFAIWGEEKYGFGFRIGVFLVVLPVLLFFSILFIDVEDRRQYFEDLLNDKKLGWFYFGVPFLESYTGRFAAVLIHLAGFITVGIILVVRGWKRGSKSKA